MVKKVKVKAYCFHCKKNVLVHNAEEKPLPNGATLVSGICKEKIKNGKLCERKVCVIIPSKSKK